MTIFELNTRFSEGANLDAAWQRGIEALQAAAHKRNHAHTSPLGRSQLAPTLGDLGAPRC